MTKATFEKTMLEIAKHNGYPLDACTTVEECDKIGAYGSWTPVDLVCREYYNNGCGSAKGFLGISPKKCQECFDYIVEHQKELKEAHRYNKDGFNNSGFPLWYNYVLD